MTFHFLKNLQLTNPEREREREREREESKQVRRLAVINLLLILTVAFLVKVVFDLNQSLVTPPHQSGVYNYKVKTSWATTTAIGSLLSSIFDTGVSGGAAFNSIMWLGNQPAGTSVAFQFASSNSTSSFPTPIGPGGTSLLTDTYNPTGSGVPIVLNRTYHNNHRYFQYKIILESDAAGTVSPRVDDVIVNWSP